MGKAQLWLDGFLGFKPGMLSFNVRLAAKVRHVEGECGQCPVFACYTVAGTLQLRKSHSRDSRKVLAAYDPLCRRGYVLR